MTETLGGYALFVAVLRGILLGAALVATAAAAVAWGVRTRRLGPFSAAGRFSRRWVDPALMPVERVLLRAGGRGATAPWWGLVILLVAGALVLTTVEAIAGVVLQIAWAVQHPAVLPVLLLSWAFTVVRVALMVRVIASWLPVPTYSRWIHWTYPLTEWILRPLRSFVPPLGAIDITPVLAYFALWLLQSLLHIP
ncbi:MAG TPA: YggT family protein [Gemmatimonadaceae bacterium]|nr:YggT family protein [Gemmatimonadaceae bacterium]